MFLIIAKDCTERLSAVSLSVGLIIPRVYRSVREKQGNVVYRQRVLQTVTSLRVVSLVFRGHDPLKIANTVEPRFNEVPRDWGNVFVKSRFVISRFYSIHFTVILAGLKKLVRYTEDLVI